MNYIYIIRRYSFRHFLSILLFRLPSGISLALFPTEDDKKHGGGEEQRTKEANKRRVADYSASPRF